MQCPLCGYEFDTQALACHTSCAFNSQCAVVCCPNCGYQLPDEGRTVLAGRLRQWLNRRNGVTHQPGDVCALDELRAGEQARVLDVVTDDARRLEKLQVLGFVRDAAIHLIQKQPTYIVQVGFTEVSLEKHISRAIRVEVV